MEEMNSPDPVDDRSVEFILRTADQSATGAINRGELRLALPLYLSLQEEQTRILGTFDKFDGSGDGLLTADELTLMMTDLNDGNTPSKAEVQYVMSQADRSGDGAIGRDEIMGAVAVWYPIVHANREVPMPPKCPHGGASEHRVKMSQRCEKMRAHCETIFKTFDKSGSGIIGSRELRNMMNAVDEEMGSSNEGAASSMDFILSTANVAHPECMHQVRIVPALARYFAMRDEVQMIDSKFSEYDTESSGSLTPVEVAQVLKMLNDGITPASEEMEWILKTADADGNGQLDHKELRKAVMIWYTHVETRRAIETDLERASSERVGLLRKAVAAQMKVHEAWVARALQDVRMQMDGTISRDQLTALMAKLLFNDNETSDVGDGQQQAVPESDVDYVIRLAEHSGRRGQFGDGAVLKSDLVVPLAMWRGLQHELQMIDAKFDQLDMLDEKRPGLTRRELRSLLTDLNDGVRPSKTELDWVFSTGSGSHVHYRKHHAGKSGNERHAVSPTDHTSKASTSMCQLSQLSNIVAQGCGDDTTAAANASTTVEATNVVLNRLQTRAAITLWFLHIQTLPIAPRTGWRMMAPFIYVFVVAVMSATIVAATTILFSEEKTVEWLVAVMMTQLWRNFLIDPLKAIMFGRTLELVFGLLLGGCALEEAALGVVQGELEGAAESFEVEIDGDIDIDMEGGAGAFVNVEMADTPETPDAAATLISDEDDNQDDDDGSGGGGGGGGSRGSHGEHHDAGETSGTNSGGRMVLGAGVSTVMGAQTADMALRSPATKKSPEEEEKPKIARP
jgi:Ca2+-binding EF-hand superfamily protein